MIKHLTTKDIITSKQNNSRCDERGNTIYALNDHFIKYHIELNSYSNRNYRNYDVNIIKRYSLEVPKTDELETVLLDRDIFID